MKIYKLFFIILYFSWFSLDAQQIMVIIEGATIHPGNGKVIENGYLGFADGKILLCDSVMKSFYKNARIINAKGKHIYPGLICMNTVVGLNEIDMVRSTHDYSETGRINPNVRSLIAYNADSKIIPTVRSNGITMVQVVPQGGLISGTSSVMKTAGWNWEDAVYKTDDGVHIYWPEFISYSGVNEKPEEVKQRMEKEFHSIEDFFDQADQYLKVSKPEITNVRLDAMRGVFKGTKNLYVHVNGARGIISSVNFIKKYPSIKMVLG
ncbi:MAG: amidohydrolase, partial [Bacteroidia bacterium]